jgi:ankyrin repeat protein
MTCVLRHGIQLTIANTSGRLRIYDVADFLAEALRHCKHLRDVLKATTYTGSLYSQTVKKGRTILGSIQLSCPNNSELSPGMWTEAVADAYSRANSVEQMLDSLSVYQEAAEDDSSYMREVVAALPKPGGDFLAMMILCRQDRQVSERSNSQELNEKLCDAVIDNDLPKALAAIAAGADVNATGSLGFTPLTGAASDGHLELLEMLLTKGAHISAPSREGMTALHWAAYSERENILLTLIANGIAVNAKDRDGRTALLYVISNQRLSRILIDSGADVNTKDKYGQTPLHYAARRGSLEIAEGLIARGADVNSPDAYGATPYHAAGMLCQYEVMRMLIDKGADISAKDCDGMTALDCAKARQNEESSKIVLRRLIRRYCSSDPP